MNITVHNAELVESAGQQAWMIAVEVDREDGSAPYLHALVLPSDTAEWRAAEYDLDDVPDDQLWSMVIHEAIVATAVSETVTVQTAIEDALVEDSDVRRKRYLERRGKDKPIKTRKKGARRPTGPTGQPLKVAGPSMKVVADSDLADPIATMSKHTPRRREHVEARRVIVDDARRRLREERGQRPVSSDDVVLQRASTIQKKKEGSQR